jgi:hypothetical protein
MTAARIRRMGGKITSNHDGGRLEREDAGQAVEEVWDWW